MFRPVPPRSVVLLIQRPLWVTVGEVSGQESWVQKGEEPCLGGGVSPPPATRPPTPGMDSKGASSLGSPVTETFTTPPPPSTCWAPLWRNAPVPGGPCTGEAAVQMPSGTLLPGGGRDEARSFQWKLLSSWGTVGRAGERQPRWVPPSWARQAGPGACSHGCGEALQLPDPPCPSSLNHNLL